MTTRNQSLDEWYSVDWGLPTSVIAEQMGVSDSLASRRRRKLAPETLGGVQAGGQGRDVWLLVDWSMPTSVIAEQLGVPPSMVSRHRRKLAPETVLETNVKTRTMVEKYGDMDWSKTDSQLSRETGLRRRRLWSIRKKLKKAGTI